MGLKVGVESPQPNLTREGDPILNTLGARVTNNAVGSAMGNNIGCMYPYLAVSETEPVESQLEIFYESSTSGNFVELNRSVTADYAGVAGVSETTGAFLEDDPVSTDIIAGFNFEDGAGNPLVLDGVPVITNIVDGNGIAQPTTLFTLAETVPTVYDDFDLETNSLFWYEADVLSKTYTLSFQTTYTTGGETFIDDWVSATDKEAEEALIKEAKKRGFKEGVRINPVRFPENDWVIGGVYKFSEGILFLGSDSLFEDGKWATIIKDKTVTLNGDYTKVHLTDVINNRFEV